MLDSTMLSCFKKCPRAFLTEYVCNYGPPPDRHLVFGQAVHAALEHLYSKEWDVEGAVERFRQVYGKYFSEAESQLNEPKGQAGGENAIRKYAEMYERDFNPEEVIATEASGTVEIGVATIAYKIDLILRNQGMYFLVDHKTSGRLRPDYGAQFNLSHQFALYTEVAERVFGMKSSFLQLYVNVLSVEKNAFSSRRYFYMAGEEVRKQLLRDFEQLYLRQAQTEALMEEGELDAVLELYPFNPWGCFVYGSRCPFHNMCSIGYDPLHQADFYNRTFEKRIWNPLNEERSISDGNTAAT